MATERTMTAVRPEAEAASTDQILIQMLTGMWLTQAVATAARLGIPDLLASGPKSSEEIASAVGAHPGATRRLMRTLASRGVFAADGDNGPYRLTEIGERLRAGTPGTLKEMFIAETDTLHWRSWERMDDAMRTGDPQPQAVFGMPAFDYYTKHREEGEQFGRAMENVSRFVSNAVLDAYDFSGARTVLDVGGGNGSMVLAILERHPSLRGLVHDLPYIEAHANERIRAAGAADRCRFVAGDFFERVPEGADLLVMKYILHDWNDEQSIRLLQACRAAIAPDGRLLIIETVVPPDNRPDLVQMMDLNMLVMTGGLERTEREYAALLEKAGFLLTRVVATASPCSLVEARPV
jgi:SAM-dependent methyltransferase